MINEGITTESVDATSAIGPPQTRAEASNIDGIFKLKAAGLDLDTSRTDTKTPYRISKTKTGYRYCFDPARKQGALDTDPHRRLVARIGQKAIDAHECGARKSDDEKPVCEKNRKSAARKALRTREEAKRVDALDFTIRSTLGIIYYLGEIALGDPRLDADAAQLVRPYLTFHGDTRDKTDVLFELRPTKATRI